MKIQLTDKELKQLDAVLSQKDENIEVSSLWNSFLDEHYDVLSKQAIDDLKKHEGLEDDEAVEEAFFNYLSLDPNDPVVEGMQEKTNFGKLHHLDETLFLNQPFNHMPIKKVVLGQYQLTYNYFEPFELFNDEDTFADKENNYAEVTHVSYFTKKIPYLVLTQKSEVWMSITPFEINTMRPYIEKAKGDVLTFGLGLGYYAFEVAKKKEVTSVTIIEKDSKVIQLFEKNILPYFENKEKIHIIKQDAFLYFDRELRETSYDTIFIDIYHTASDALPLYLRFKKSEAKYGYSNITYWIEESILCLLRRYVLVLIEEYFQGYNKESYTEVYDDETKILYELYCALEKREFKSFTDIEKLLSNEGLIELSKSL